MMLPSGIKQSIPAHESLSRRPMRKIIEQARPASYWNLLRLKSFEAAPMNSDKIPDDIRTRVTDEPLNSVDSFDNSVILKIVTG
eukprot:scaffold79006_cov53-Cyclotella_meneghiniana.AAC.1